MVQEDPTNIEYNEHINDTITDSKDNIVVGSLPERVFQKRRRHYTCIIFIIFLFYGAAYNIWGPSWNALVTLFDTDQESMSYGNSLFALGYFFGSMTCKFHIFWILLGSLLDPLWILLDSFGSFLCLFWILSESFLDSFGSLLDSF